MSVVDIHQGRSPVILGLPHTGTDVPPEIWERLNDNGQLLADTDWHIHELYAGLLSDATTVRATFHRYVIDANRDPSGTSLYPGQNTTGLVPETDFDGEAIRAGARGLKPGDVLVVAGKGHETGQIVGTSVLPFSDHEVLRAAIAEVNG